MADKAALLYGRATPTPTTGQIRIVAIMLLTVDFLLIALFFGLHQTGFRLYLVLLGAGRSLPAWYAAMKLLMLGQMLVLLALALRTRVDPRASCC